MSAAITKKPLIVDSAFVLREESGISGWSYSLEAGAHKKFDMGAEKDIGTDRAALTALVTGVAEIKGAFDLEIRYHSEYLKTVIETVLPKWRSERWGQGAHGDQNFELWRRLDQLLAKHRSHVFVYSTRPAGDILPGLAIEAAENLLNTLLDNACIPPAVTPAQSNVAPPQGNPVGTKQNAPLAQQAVPPVSSEVPASVPAGLSGVEASAIDLLKECLPLLCAGLPLEFLKKNVPDSLAVRVAAICEV